MAKTHQNYQISWKIMAICLKYSKITFKISLGCFFEQRFNILSYILTFDFSNTRTYRFDNGIMNEYILLFRLDKMISLTWKIEILLLNKRWIKLNNLEGAIKKFWCFVVNLFVDYWAFHPILVTSLLVVFGNEVTKILCKSLFIFHFVLPMLPCNRKKLHRNTQPKWQKNQRRSYQSTWWGGH